MSFADTKKMARRVVHNVLAIPCIYTPPNNGAARELTARFHDRMKIGGGDGGDQGGYSAILEGVTRVVFNQEQLDDLGVTLEQNGTVLFPDYGIKVRLNSEFESDGPIEQKWSVGPAP